MHDFHYINLPKEITVFAVSITEFSTICNYTRSGREVRDSTSTKPRRNYLLRECRLSRLQFETFSSFFYARCGRRYGFLLTDYNDHIGCKQLIGVGREESEKSQEFQLIKIYPDPISPYVREITKPIHNSVSVYTYDTQNIKMREQRSASVEETTGMITLLDELALGVQLFADFKFNVPVRFAEDSFQYNANNDGTISLDNVRLVEIL